MTELDQLGRRRELVMLSASLQRATLSRRLDAVQARPGRSFVQLAMGVFAKPLTRKLALAAVALAWRSIRRRRAAQA